MHLLFHSTNNKPLFTYCVTCSCLTPIGNLSEITKETGIHAELIRADSQQDAESKCRERLAADFKEHAAVQINDEAVGVLDENGHMVNYFYHFRSHLV